MSDHDILSDEEREAINAVMQEPEALPLKALIVDDDQGAREVLAEILQLHGIQCLTANSAAQALRSLAADKSIGLLITDLRIGPFDGLELIRQIRESERSALPIVIISGDADVKDAIAAMHLSVVDFLLKPIDSKQLITLARRELGLDPQA
ncbi:response regulator [Pseudomonas sp. LS1212]|uniref:response regulator n=1 Tax=Pseudomonas sp. LS1212 TaxID=2972478 RepID=UPI00215C9365|nr:response regulator [Pseudomonas sp. LS1212]UVJ46664.1 response regulator [Pseudomonas sp. LS1212]